MHRPLQHVLGFALAIALGRAAAQDPPTPTAAVSPKTGQAEQAQPQGNPLFMAAHQALLKKKSQGVINVYFLGDSITRRWQGTDYPEHKKNWDQNFFGWNAANFGWGGDSTQNVLWRLQNGEIDGVHPKVVVLLIGTNNLGNLTSPNEIPARTEQVTRGIRAIIDAIQEKAPAAKIVLMGITPRNDQNGISFMPAIDNINSRIAEFADGKSIVFLNINDQLTNRDGKLLEGMTADGLHLSVKGYQIWADALKPLFTQWLGPPGETDQAPPASGIPNVASDR
jgi:lysophospholipase L1-like esterase